MKAHWNRAAFGLAAILVAASAHAGHGNQGGNKTSGGNQFRVQSNNFGGNNGGLKVTPSFSQPSLARSGGSNNTLGLPKFSQNGNTGIVPKIGGQTFKPQILTQNNGAQNGLGIKLGTVKEPIKTIGLNNGPKLDKIGIKPADLGIKSKPLDPGFSKNAKPIGLGVLANGNGILNGNKNGNVQSSKKINGVGLGLGIGLGVMKNLMGNHHHHCHDFCQPNYCWPSSCQTIDCCNYYPCQPTYCCLPPVTVVEVVTVIELPPVMVVDPMAIAPPPPEVDPTAIVPATDVVATQPAVTQPAVTDASLVTPTTDATTPAETEAAARSLTETPVSTTAAAPVEDANLVKIQVGSQVELKGKDLGVDAGQVVVQVGDLMLPATMKEWKNDAVKAELPRIGVANPTKAFLHVIKPDGKFASSLPCMLIAPPQPAK